MPTPDDAFVLSFLPLTINHMPSIPVIINPMIRRIILTQTDEVLPD
jgi:hypothetical protein